MHLYWYVLRLDFTFIFKCLGKLFEYKTMGCGKISYKQCHDQVEISAKICLIFKVFKLLNGLVEVRCKIT